VSALCQLSAAGMLFLSSAFHAGAGEPVLLAKNIDELLAAHRQNPARFMSQYASGRKLRAVGEVREIESVSRSIYQVSFRTGRSRVACKVNQSLAASVSPGDMVDFEGLIQDVTHHTLLLSSCRFIVVPDQAAAREQAAKEERQLKAQELLEQEKRRLAIEQRVRQDQRPPPPPHPAPTTLPRASRSPQEQETESGDGTPQLSCIAKIVELLSNNISAPLPEDCLLAPVR
jgi:hypothetical protein